MTESGAGVPESRASVTENGTELVWLKADLV